MTKEDREYHRKRGAEIVAQIQAAQKKHAEDMDDRAQAFEDWWNGDEEDEPITDISKDRAAEIFFDGYEMGSRKSVYMMSESQQKLLIKMIGEKIRAEEREACAHLVASQSRGNGLMSEETRDAIKQCAAAIRNRSN